MTDNPSHNKYDVKIIIPGFYCFTVEEEYEGNTYSDTAAIVVLDEAQLDALLKAK